MCKINGAIGSPYSMKIRALMGYRRIAHLWVQRPAACDALTKVKAPAAEAPLALIFTVGLPYRQGVFKYQTKRLADLRACYAALDSAARAKVDPLLAEACCRYALLGQ